MKKYKYSDTLIIDDDNNRVFLANSYNIEEVAFNDGSYSKLYRFEDGEMIPESRDDLLESDFDDIYEEYTDYDEECGHEKIEIEDCCGDTYCYVKAEWGNYEHYLRLESEHGINTVFYYITDAEIIEGECFKAEYVISQDYPDTECQRFFKFVSDEGKEYFIKETIPFFLDESDYSYELVTREEFEEYD